MLPAFHALRVPFERLRASRLASIKAADMRVGATLVLFGVTLGIGVMLALTPASTPQRSGDPAAADRWVGRQAESAPVSSVKIVDAGTRREIPCAEQTWPYIDRRCLTLAEPKPPIEAREQPARVAAASAEQDYSERKEVALPQPRPQIALAGPENRNVKSEATATAIVSEEDKSAPATTATPVALATTQPEKRVLKLTEKVGPAAALSVAPVKRGQRVAKGKLVEVKPRIVSRWTEKVYDLGDGRTHRVVTVRQGSGPAGYGGARRAWPAYAAEGDED
jgi:hypothetical protein